MVNTYTTENGLASNMVYDFVEDNNGFLWIAADNGVYRFDGNHFYNYSIKDGLLSNDVLQVIKQQDGTIWVNCFKRPHSYFDQNRNQFITVTNKTIENISKSFLKKNTITSILLKNT